MTSHNWIKEFPGAVTVCDREGIILDMNNAAIEVFESDGGAALLGSNLLDCHPGTAREKLEMILKTQQPNAYTIEKQGRKKIIYQTPWYEDGEYAGFVELSLVLPDEMPHFIRG